MYLSTGADRLLINLLSIRYHLRVLWFKQTAKRHIIIYSQQTIQTDKYCNFLRLLFKEVITLLDTSYIHRIRMLWLCYTIQPMIAIRYCSKPIYDPGKLGLIKIWRQTISLNQIRSITNNYDYASLLKQNSLVIKL